LSVASGAAQLGVRTVLIERGKMGGDCLNTGCVPSKSLISAAKSVSAIKGAAKFGVSAGEPRVDYSKVMAHVNGVIATIAPNDSVERFEGLGCTVIQAEARFVARDVVEAGGQRIKAKRFVIATGSRAAVPPIPGLDTVAYLTNENIFELEELPRHLVVIGGGPIGLELSQAFRRLGSEVSIVEGATLLGKDDEDLVAVVREQVIADGVDVREGIMVKSVEAVSDGVAVALGDGSVLTGSHLLVAAGRTPNVDSLGLDLAGVAFDRSGIKVDARLRTSNKRIFAIGDVAGGLQFTHVAGYHAGLVIRNALFRVPAKVDVSAVPWVTYTDPELAHVGLTEAAARAQFGDKVQALRWDFEENDRALAEGDTRGFLKVVVGAKGQILGASMVGAGAGELIQPWVLALSQGLKIGAFTSVIAPYPTRGEISKRVAGAWYTPALFSSRTRLLVKVLSWLG
jgi:pyruvate/2-oxoglutarate dehydrogenase complex dihydrolipoamide dehydrogenase (E3) component